MRYECFISPGFHRAEIDDASSMEDAKRQFVELIVDNLDVTQVEASNLDTEDGEDPECNVPAAM